VKTPPRVLIEDWLPAAAIGVECMRERSTGQQPPDKRFHVWWARRPLTVSRAAVLGSLLPADFPRAQFEKLLGFWGTSDELVRAQAMLDRARERKLKIPNPHGERAFKHGLPEKEMRNAQRAIEKLWGRNPVVMDPMAGGGSIPLEAARLGLTAKANEYNPVACLVLEATVDFPFRFGKKLGECTRKWGAVLRERFNKRMSRFYPKTGEVPPLCYILARTVPCPDTGHMTPLLPYWHLLKPRNAGRMVMSEPVVNKSKGAWSVFIRDPWTGRHPPPPTYTGGGGTSLFSPSPILGDYIVKMAEAGKMQAAIQAVVEKANKLAFRTPVSADFEALREAERELTRQLAGWTKCNTIPSEAIPAGDKTREVLIKGMDMWSKLFTPRQLLAMGTLVEELRGLEAEIVKAEGEDLGEAVACLLAIALDKFANYNHALAKWESTSGVMKGRDRHDYAFKMQLAEMAPCNAGSGLDWAIDNAIEAYEGLAHLPKAENARPVLISLGSAASLPNDDDSSVTAVVVDPPYAGNVQYAELADFFYVWLKRTQVKRRPEWFGSYLCDKTEEAVVNLSRHRRESDKKGEAERRAHAFYQRLMTDTFREAKRVLRDDGVLTVMFTHKLQSAWAALLQSLLHVDPDSRVPEKRRFGFQITATWPVKTESELSTHLARKNAAQSTVLLICRKRPDDAETGYYGPTMEEEVRNEALSTAQRLDQEGFTNQSIKCLTWESVWCIL